MIEDAISFLSHDLLTGYDISTRVISYRHSRGRSSPFPSGDRYGAGTATIRLRNHDGAFSPRNTSSIYYPDFRVGAALFFTVDYGSGNVPRWFGFITKIRPVAADVPYVEVEAKTGLGILERASVRAEGISEDTTGAAIAHILDAVGWSATLRDIATGIGSVKHWRAKSSEFASKALNEIADTELGFLYDSAGGDIVFEDRHHRLTLASSDTWSDDPADGEPFYGIGVELLEGEDGIVNAAESRFTRSTTLINLLGLPTWAYTETFTLAPSESREIIAELPTYQSEDDDGNAIRSAYSLSWGTPDPDTTDGLLSSEVVHDGAVANGDLDVVVSETTAFTAKITITNNGTATATITKVEIPVLLHVFDYDATLSRSVDQDSIDDYGERSSQAVGMWFESLNTAQAWTQYLTRRFALPENNDAMRIPFVAEPWPSVLYAREISDRVTVKATKMFTQFALTFDAHIEAIEESMEYRNDGRSLHSITFTVSRRDESGYFIVGTSSIGGSDILMEL